MPGRHLPRVRARRPQHRHPVSRDRHCPTRTGAAAEARGAGPARHPPVEPRPGHRRAHRGPGAQHHQDAPERSASSGSSAPTTSRATIGQSGLRGVPRRLCQRPRPEALERLRAVRQRRHVADASIRPSPRTNPAIRCSTPSRARSRPSQCMICHMHQPNVFVNTFSATPCGTTRPTRPAMWPKKQQYPIDRRGTREVLDRNPGGRGARAASGRDPEFLRDVSPLNPQAQGHAVRRLSRPRLEFPRRLQARPQGQPARRQAATSVADDDPQKFQKAVHLASIHMSSWACSASTATSRRTPTATATSTARWRPRSRSTARIATAPSSNYPDALHQRARRRRRAAPTCRCCARRTAARASNGATASSTSARRSIPTSNGR